MPGSVTKPRHASTVVNSSWLTKYKRCLLTVASKKSSAKFLYSLFCGVSDKF